MYAHEVTLHELDVIHDGSDLRGPMRLRLKLFTPRFVTRYSALRDQIARLNVDDEPEAPVEDAADGLQEPYGVSHPIIMHQAPP